MSKKKFFLSSFLFLFSIDSFLLANVIGFVEDFSLAPDRSLILRELIPGTPDYYYYHALHAQHQDKHEEVKKLLKAWIKRHGNTPRSREIQNRQALLTYNNTPKVSLDYLKEQLRLRFDHSRKVEGRKPSHPTKLDPKLLSYEVFYKDARQSYKNMQGFENRGLRKIDPSSLSSLQKRNFLERLRFPDIPNLPTLIVQDLRDKQSRGFGSLPVHQTLTKQQLDELVSLEPTILNSDSFVRNYLSRLTPSNDLNWEEETDEKSAWLNRQLVFTRSLSPAFNSLKANVLFNVLRHKCSQNQWDRALFLEYLALPRFVNYLRRDWTQGQMKKEGAQAVNLNDAFINFGGFPPIGNEVPLVRSMLLHFFREDSNYEPFSKFLTDEFLNPVFAEAKLTAGKGEAERWYSLLSTAQLQNLRERIDLSFAVNNRQSFAPEEKVELKLWTKNIDRLMIKEFEINAFNYYLKNGEEVSTSIELDGLSATRERMIESSLPPVRRKLQSVSFPKLKKRGVYVVEFIGNGISSRALIRKGTLRLLEKIGPAGHEFRILDESNQLRENATLWLNGKEFTPRDGIILVPFSNQPGDQTVILREGNFASLASFNHLGEEYKLRVGFHIDRESLRGGENASLLVRPSLRLNGHPTSLQLLKKCKLIIIGSDHEDQPTRMEVPIEKLVSDKEFIHQFRVPDRMHRLEFILEAEVENLSSAKKVLLRDSLAFTVNEMDLGTKIASPLLLHSNDGFIMEIRGKNGEPLIDYSVPFAFKHTDFRRTRNHTLKTDENGRIELGYLARIEWIQSQTPYPRKWRLEKHFTGRSILPTLVHAIEGEDLSFPFPRLGNQFPTNEFSLLEKRMGGYFQDHSDKIRALPGLLKITGLPAADFELHHHPSSRSVIIRVTRGENKSGFAVSKSRILERSYGPPLSISSVIPENDRLVISLANATTSTRVHVLGTAYVPAFDIHTLLQTDPVPSPSSVRLAHTKTRYVEERDIGEEYRYVLERRNSARFPGNLLPRPGLLINPWSVSTTETAKKEAKAGNDYQNLIDDADRRSSTGIKQRKSSDGRTDPANLDFLAYGTLLQGNLQPDERGIVSIEIPDGRGYRMLRLVAVDPVQVVSLDFPLADTSTIRRERRMGTDLDGNTAHAKKKQVSLLEADQSFKIVDFTTSRFRAIDSLKDAYDLLLTIHENSIFREFNFLLDWPVLEEKQKLEKYRAYASHELHFFLHRKDPEFFRKEIIPYLANKKEPTFLDNWFLKQDLSQYLEPVRFEKLNAFEKALLSTTRFASEKEMSRHLSEKSDLSSPSLDQFDRLFEITLKSAFMDTGPGKLEKLGRLARNITAENSASALNFLSTAPSSSVKPIARSMDFKKLKSAMGNRAESAEDSPARDMLALEEELTPPVLNSRGRSPEEKKKNNQTAWDSGLDGSETIDSFGDSLDRRQQARSLYRKIGKVMEWAESNYFRVAQAKAQNPQFIPANSYWSDYARHLATGDGPFLSGNFIYATRNPTEMLLALSVLDLPFKSTETKIEVKDRSVTLKPKQGLIFFHEQLLPSATAQKSGFLISQRFYRLDSRYRFENGERIDNFVDREFLPGVPYGSIVVLTNPTSSLSKLRLLLHLPNGSMPLNQNPTVRSIPVTLEAYSTQTFESSFYFPMTGEFELYPARASSDDRSIASAPLFSFKVVEELSKKDQSSWSWVSQNGTDQDVLNYLKNNNLFRTDLALLAFRLRGKNEGGSGKLFYQRLLKQLETRFHYHSTVWSYSFYHDDIDRFQKFLAKSAFANQCGQWIDSPLLRLDPAARGRYEQLEYSPLVHARAHRLGKERRILNDRLRSQYLNLLEVFKYKPVLDQEDHLMLTYYLFAQDRIEEGLSYFDQVDRKKIRGKIQYDYFSVHAAFYRLQLDQAEKIARGYENFSIERWKKLFGEALSHLSEAREGLDPEVVDEEDRDQKMDQLADTEPTFSFEFINEKIRIDHGYIKNAKIRFYPMEVELLFSRQPFARNDADHFTFVSPDGEDSIMLEDAVRQTTYSLPEKYRRRNVMIEIESGGKRKAKAYYANRLNTEIIPDYGRIRILHTVTGKPLPQVYVKTYARMKNGEVRFYKDGYTDLRGKFEYASLNTNDLDQVDRFALLVIDPDAGAQIEEVPPPSQ